jgi:hypothetical protein
MRTLALVVCAGALVACSQEKPVVVKTASQAPDLSPAPSSYTRMRFVSPVEQGKAATAVKAMPRRQEKPSPLASLSSAPVHTVATQMASAPQAESSVAVAAPTIAEPPHMAMPAMEDGGVLDHSGDTGRGILTNVVIRGGNGGSGKCDPRTDTHTTPKEIGRPDFSMPVYTGRSVFGGKGR